MIEVLPYSREAFKDFSYNGIEKDVCEENILPILDYYSTRGECYYGRAEGKILGVGGIYPLWPEAAGCFLFLNQEAQKYKKDVFKVLLEYMNNLIKKYVVKRLIVECMRDSFAANNLITHLGFIKRKEIMMAIYTKGV